MMPMVFRDDDNGVAMPHVAVMFFMDDTATQQRCRRQSDDDEKHLFHSKSP